MLEVSSTNGLASSKNRGPKFLAGGAALHSPGVYLLVADEQPALHTGMMRSYWCPAHEFCAEGILRAFSGSHLRRVCAHLLCQALVGS